jgi:hypothetical protein
VGEKYSFSGNPSLGQVLPMGTVALPNTVTSFHNGKIMVGAKEVAIIRLDFIPQTGFLGLVTHTTEDGDAVLDDLSKLLESDFGFRNIRKYSERYYISNLIVEFGAEMESYINKIAAIQKIINPAMKERLGFNEDVKFERMTFGFDPTLVPMAKAQFIAGFTLERRLNSPYKDNRFFSSAPLTTKEHTRLLKEIGALIEGE